MKEHYTVQNGIAKRSFINAITKYDHFNTNNMKSINLQVNQINNDLLIL